MKLDVTKVADMMMTVMQSQTFAEWYEKRYVEMLSDSEQGPKEKDVREELIRIIKRRQQN